MTEEEWAEDIKKEQDKFFNKYGNTGMKRGGLTKRKPKIKRTRAMKVKAKPPGKVKHSCWNIIDDVGLGRLNATL